MEDRNILAADCIVLCCCCQCMMLQILIFILLKLPHKLMKKTKEYVKKFRVRKRGTKINMQIETARNGEDSFPIPHGGSFAAESLQLGCCMSEIEHVLDDLSSRGVFAFGSFWDGGFASDTSFPSSFNHDQLDYEVVGYRLMELFGAANFSSQH